MARVSHAQDSSYSFNLTKTMARLFAALAERAALRSTPSERQVL
jgi:hypothetical protein